jgi:NAD+ synthase
MVALYYEAEKRGYAVVGTTNKTERLTGFYVKWGDDSSDIEPLLHLYKTQVFELAQLLGVPRRIIEKKPSPDLAPGITDEYAMGIPYMDLDRILQKMESAVSLEDEDPELVKKVQEIVSAAHVRDMRNLSIS